MVGSDPNPAPHEPHRAHEITTTVMDFDVKDQYESEEDMVHDLLLDHSPIERDKILSRLRRLQRRQEIKSSQEQAKSDLPAFVSIPRIDLAKLRGIRFPENSYHVKSLLQYHYKFGIHNDTVQRPDFDLASILGGVRSPWVEEVWCLAFDSKNLITISWLEADSIWPILSPGTQYSEPWTAVPRIAMDEYFQNDRHPPQQRYADLASSKSGLVVVDLMETRMEADEEWWFSPLRTVVGFSPGCYDGEPLRNLSALDEHMQHWIEVERTTWGQAEASEEVAQAIRDLWLIAIRFTTNFHLSPDRDIFQLDRLSMWRRIVNYIRHGSEATSATTEVLYRPNMGRNRPETLQDLENELAVAIANLNRYHGTAQSELQATREGRISQLEWLVRDSVSQSQIYQISAISDELRILKEILHSQMQVVSQVAQSLAKAMASSTSAKAVKGKEPESVETHALPGTGKESLGHERVTQIFNSLQKKSQLRHRKLAYDIEKLQDTTERLKSQAALFIKIKAEDQSVAIYVFTFITVVFLPLSFATSYMGMNTSDIRDMKQGQWIFWAVGGVLTGAKMEESEADSEAVTYGLKVKRGESLQELGF
ncbi:Mg2+ transporter like zinc transport [Fusarium sp. NRRL 52700]|nr:Mg2+ transporter like zinc transport [Fusarium sp. NRRL 52700]